MVHNSGHCIPIRGRPCELSAQRIEPLSVGTFSALETFKMSKVNSISLGAVAVEAPDLDSVSHAPPSPKPETSTKADPSANHVSAFVADATSAAKAFDAAVSLAMQGPTISAAMLLFGAEKAFETLSGKPPEKQLKNEDTVKVASPKVAEQSKPQGLAKGAKGDDVKTLQQELKRIGMSVKDDGDFGAKTEAALRRFQKEHQLPQTGTADESTLKALEQTSTAKAGRTEHFIEYTPGGTPMMKQNDVRWGGLHLGNSNKSIGGSGCLLTSMAMVLSQKLGRDVSPQELNGILIAGKAFQKKGAVDAEGNIASGAQLVSPMAYKAIEAHYGVTMGECKRTDSSGKAIANAIDESLKSNNRPILRLDTNLDGAGDHFAVVDRREDGNVYVVVDPSYGEERKYHLTSKGEFVAVDGQYGKTPPKAVYVQT